MAFRCLAQDVMTEICLNVSSETLEVPEFDSELIKEFDASLPTFVYLKHFPRLRRLLFALPEALIFPGEASLRRYQSMVAEKIIKTGREPNSLNEMPFETVLRRMISPSESNSTSMSTQSIIEEFEILIAAGGETVAGTTVLGFHNILQQPQLYAGLRVEIASVWPGSMDRAPGVEVLEKLPLLTATIKESLRLSHGTVSPQPRIIPPSGARIDGNLVPGGTSVGMSSVFIHLSPEIFQDPLKFEPQRWTRSSIGGGSELDRWLVAFGKGPRSCAGVNLAWCELYLTFATLIRMVRMQFIESLNDSEMKWRDCFTPYYVGRHLQVRCAQLGSNGG
jgi:cytochrome P450